MAAAGLEEFRGLEEPLQFSGGGGRPVGRVADVDHLIDAEVAADGALGRLARVGRPEQIAHAGDDIRPR